MWHFGTRFSGGLGSVRFTVLDLKGLFQPKLFYDSQIHSQRSLSVIIQSFSKAFPIHISLKQCLCLTLPLACQQHFEVPEHLDNM